MSNIRYIQFKNEKSEIFISRPQATNLFFENSDQLASAPQPPLNLVIVQILSATSIAIDWDASLSDNVNSYTVYVQNNATGLIEQTITGIQLTEAEVVGLTTDDEYEFWVVSVRDDIESEDSNHVTETPVQIIPDAPTNFAVEVIGVIGTEWAYYSADEETIYSDGNALTTITDQVNGDGGNINNSSGQIVYEENSLNGHSAYQSLGTSHDDRCKGAFSNTLSQPFTVGLILRVDGGNGGAMFFDGNIQSQVRMGTFSTFKPLINAGASVSTDIAVNDNVYRAYLGIINGANSEFWINNQLEGAGDVGSNELSGLTLFASGSGFQDMRGGIAEIRIYNRVFNSDEITEWFSYAKNFGNFNYTI